MGVDRTNDSSPQADLQSQIMNGIRKEASRGRRAQTDSSAAIQGESPVDPPFAQWSVRDAKKLGTGRAGDTESPGVQEIEHGTSGITLAQDTDIKMQDSGQLEATRSPRNGRKRTGDSSGAGSLALSHAAQSPKRTRALQTTRKYEPGGPGGISGSGRSRKNQQATTVDPDFDRSRYDVEQPGEIDESGAARGVPQQRRLFDPARDHPGAFRTPEDSSKRLGEIPAVRPPRDTRVKREQKKKPQGMDSRLYNHRNQQVPTPAQQPVARGSREGGRVMVLGNVARQPQHGSIPEEEDETPCMVGQPETRPISPEQLVAEVKGIYAGLVMVEAKCCEVDAKQAAAAQDPDGKHPRLNNEQWQALIALHRTLLHEHHDFLLASQHPSASESLCELALKYAMPARMWRHGIHSFLELLRHHLPYSLEHMLTFIYLAYSMMALLYETVPAFEDTWIECLGDLGRYRMAIEDGDARDRDVWTKVARFWYSKAADKTPYVGRLHHHLAILARPNVLQQLFYYCKSLGVSQPFSSARESILTLFDPIFAPDSISQKAHPVDTGFIQLHGINFTHIDLEKFDGALDSYLSILDTHINDPNSKWKVPGGYVAVCNIIGLYQYGAKDSLLRQAWRQGRWHIAEEEMEDAPKVPEFGDGGSIAEFDGLLPPLPDGADSEHVTSLLPRPTSRLGEGDQQEVGDGTKVSRDAAPSAGFTAQEISLNYSKRLAYDVLKIVLGRIGDTDVLPHMHIWLVFVLHIKASEPATRLLENEFPWEPLVAMLNSLIMDFEGDRFECEAFPTPEKSVGRPLPEDYTLRGLDWSQCFPERWFSDAQVDDEERSMELPSMAKIRVERILWLATRIAASGDHLVFKDRSFAVHPSLLQRIEEFKIISASAQAKPKVDLVQEDPDVEMSEGDISEDDDYVLVDQSEEVRRLKQQKRQLKSQLRNSVTGDVIEKVKGFVAKGPEALKAQYTVLVVDTNLLLSHPETFNLIVSTKGWSVVIPNCVITELLGLTNNSGNVGDAAKAAIIAINHAVSEKRDIKVVTSKGSNVTNIGFYKEQLERHGEDGSRNIDDIIIQTTQQQRAIRREVLGTAGEAEPAVLITEDVGMRVKANARGVTALAASVVRRSLSSRKENTDQEFATTTITGGDISARSKRNSTGAPLATLKHQYPDWQEKDIVFALSKSNGDVDGAIAQMKIGEQKKRQNKREKLGVGYGADVKPG